MAFSTRISRTKLFNRRINSSSVLLRSSVHTWSPLGSAFNANPSLEPGTHGSSPYSGAFLYKQLSRPVGYTEFLEESVATAESMVREVVNTPPSEQVVQIIDDISDTLCRVADLSEFIRQAHPDVEFARVAEHASLSVSALVERLNTDPTIYRSLRRFVESQGFLESDSETRVVAKLLLDEFEFSGIHLDSESRRRFVALAERNVLLGNEFMRRSCLATRVRVSAIPEAIRPCFLPSSSSSASVTIDQRFYNVPSAEAREFAYRAYLHSDAETETVLESLLRNRCEIATLTGFSSYAARALTATMAGTPDYVAAFLEGLSDSLRPLWEAAGTRETPPWDFVYLMNSRRTADLASFRTTPYFSVGSVMEGINGVVASLFNIELVVEAVVPGEVWSPEVYKLAVVDRETSETLGLIYCDLFDRDVNKPPMDCHFTIRCGRQLPNSQAITTDSKPTTTDSPSFQLPIVVINVCLGRAPSPSCPTLLTFPSVSNLFHEFGHAIHSILGGRTRYQHASGTRCYGDFAEFPSTLMEHFARDRRVLRSFAKHYHTGETIPEPLLDKLLKSENLFSSYELSNQVHNSLLDQRLHGNDPLSRPISETAASIDSPLAAVPGTAPYLRFSHLVGYGARYYSYQLSRALSALVWQSCFARDPFSGAQGDRLRRHLLAYGGTKDPWELVSGILGYTPSHADLVNSLITDHNSGF